MLTAELVRPRLRIQAKQLTVQTIDDRHQDTAADLIALFQVHQSQTKMTTVTTAMHHTLILSRVNTNRCISNNNEAMMKVST